jgi:protein-arginine kinase activator protein McsA
MPVKSAKQKKLMDAAAHNPAFAKKVGIPVSVAKEMSTKSKGMTFKAKGGTVNRVGDAVTPSRRDPDIGKMIKEVKTPNVKHSGKAGLNQKKFGGSKGTRYASGGMAKKGKGC